MTVEVLELVAGLFLAVTPIYVFLFRMNRSLGEVKSTCEHNPLHLERLNDDVDRNRAKINHRS